MNTNIFTALLKYEANDLLGMRATRRTDRADSISLKSCPVMKGSGYSRETTSRLNSSGFPAKAPRLNLTNFVPLSKRAQPARASTPAPRIGHYKSTERKIVTGDCKYKDKHAQDKKNEQLIHPSKPRKANSPKSKLNKCKSKFCGQSCASKTTRKEIDFIVSTNIQPIHSKSTVYGKDDQYQQLPDTPEAKSRNAKHETKISVSAHNGDTTSANRRSSFTVVSPNFLKISKSVNDASTAEARNGKTQNGQSGPFPLKQAKECLTVIGPNRINRKSVSRVVKKIRRKPSKTKSTRKKKQPADDIKETKNRTDEQSLGSKFSEKANDGAPNGLIPVHDTVPIKSDEFVPLDQYTDEEQESGDSESDNREDTSSSRSQKTAHASGPTQPPAVSSPVCPGGDTASKMVEALVSVESTTTQTLSNDSSVSTSTSSQSQNYSQSAETQTVRQTFRNVETTANVSAPAAPVISSHSNAGDGPSIVPQYRAPMLPHDIASSESPSPTPSATAVLTQTSETNVEEDLVYATNDSSSGSGAIITTAVSLASPSESVSTAFNPTSTTGEVPEGQNKGKADESVQLAKKATKKQAMKKKHRIRKQKRRYTPELPVVKNVKSRGVQVCMKKLKRLGSAHSLPSKPVAKSRSAVPRSSSRRSSPKSRRVTISPSRVSAASSPARTSHVWRDRDSSSDGSYSKLHLREIAAKTVRHNRLFNERRRTLRAASPYPTEAASCQRLGEILQAGMQPRPPLLQVVHRNTTARPVIAVKATRGERRRTARSAHQVNRMSQRKMATTIARFLQQLSSDKYAIRLINSMATLAAKQSQ